MDIAARVDVKLPGESDELEEDRKECYFAKLRRSTHEREPRPKQSEVGVNCHGPLKRFENSTIHFE